METIDERIQRIMELARKNQSQAVSSDGFRQEHECLICKDAHYVADTENGIVSIVDLLDSHIPVRLCECEQKRQIRRMFASSHITEEFQKLGFQNFSIENRPQAVKTAFDASLDYLKKFFEIKDSRCNSIALLGKPGCGKTHLLMAVCNNLLRKNVPVMYFPWVEGMNELKDNLDSLEKKMSYMRDVAVLYIDDLYKGRKTPTDWSLEQLFGVVNYRYLNHKPTLLSCERDIDDLCTIDEGIGSRLYEMSRNHTVLIKLTKEEQESGIKLNYRIR